MRVAQPGRRHVYRVSRRFRRSRIAERGKTIRFCSTATPVGHVVHEPGRVGRKRPMRILVSCLQSRKRYPIPAYEFWRPYFVQGLQEAGHEVLEVPGVDWAEGLIYPRGPELESLRARTRDAPPAYV